MAISELGLQQTLLQGFQSAQESAQVSQVRIATGDQFQRFSEFGADTLSLLSAESIVERSGAFVDASQIAQSRQELIGGSLSEVASSLEDIRAGITRALATGASELLSPEVATETQRIISSLNIEFGGVFLFGGVNGAERPVDITSLSDLNRDGDLNDIFNEGARTSFAIEEGVILDGGPIASEVATPIFEILQEFENAPETLGRFEGILTDEQSRFVTDLSQRLATVIDGVFGLIGENAIAQNAAAEAVARNQQRSDFAEIVAADIENADIAAAIARLNQDQLAIEASAQTLAQVSQLSLLNFI